MAEESEYFVQATGKFKRSCQAHSRMEARTLFEQTMNEGARLTRVTTDRGAGWYLGHFIGPHMVSCSATGPKAAKEKVRKMKLLHPKAVIIKAGRMSGESGC